MKSNLLTETEMKAIDELKKILDVKLGKYSVTLFGSKARGESEEYSDIDLLIVTDKEVDSRLERGIFDDAYDIELEYEIIFGLIIRSNVMWKKIEETPLGYNINKEGVHI